MPEVLTKPLPEWWQEIEGANRRWLLLGKGPTFQRRGEFDLSRYFTVALNHTIRELSVDVASAIDMDVVRDCADAIDRNARFLLMPRFPAEQYHASDRPLETYFDELPLLRKLNGEGRLIWYNLSNTTEVFSGSPVIPSGYFSAEMVTTLIAMSGGRHIRTLGVDGGITYATTFRDLDYRTRLANGQPSFDMQFAGIAREIRDFDLDFAPLTWTAELPIRIYIGADESETMVAKVLEYSLRKLCPVSIQWAILPSTSPPAHAYRDVFCQVASIPGRAEYYGHAAFLDARSLVFKSFRELWELPFDDKRWMVPEVWPRKVPPGIVLLDCDRLKWVDRPKDSEPPRSDVVVPPTAEIEVHWARHFAGPNSRTSIPEEWCVEDRYVPEKTALLRYTDATRLPWKNARHPDADLWVSMLHEAVRHRFILWDEVVQAVWRGEIRRSILEQVAVPPEKWAAFNRFRGPMLDLYWNTIGLAKIRRKHS